MSIVILPPQQTQEPSQGTVDILHFVPVCIVCDHDPSLKL